MRAETCLCIHPSGGITTRIGTIREVGGTAELCKSHLCSFNTEGRGLYMHGESECQVARCQRANRGSLVRVLWCTASNREDRDGSHELQAWQQKRRSPPFVTEMETDGVDVLCGLVSKD